MSADNIDGNASSCSCCASCGVAGNDDIKLKNCTACYLVRYCSVKCQKEHWPKHKKECKKRAAELRDEILFKQPESNHLGDCPICCLPLPIDQGQGGILKIIYWSCCSKYLCAGCCYSNQKREVEMGLDPKCPFCRELMPSTAKEGEKLRMKRVDANDPAALRHMGTQSIQREDYKGAFEYWSRAAKLGDVVSHFQLSVAYKCGDGVEKNEKKQIYHLEKAAIAGHPDARFNLGCIELDNGRYERAVKHRIIAANLGHDKSLANLKDMYERGMVSKEAFDATLRAHQAAVDATKSPEREVGEAAQRPYNNVCR